MVSIKRYIGHIQALTSGVIKLSARATPAAHADDLGQLTLDVLRGVQMLEPRLGETTLQTIRALNFTILSHFHIFLI